MKSDPAEVYRKFERIDIENAHILPDGLGISMNLRKRYRKF